MNTKRYRAYYKQLADSGKLPRELYDEIEAEISRAGKMTHDIFNNCVLSGLEKYRLFDVAPVPFTEKGAAKTDGTFVYIRPKNPFWHIAHAVTSTIFKFFGWLGSGLFYGMWRMPRKYKKKFKGVGACFTTSNHVGYVDCTLTRRALGVKKQRIVAAPFNCKKTLGGALLRSATVIPLPSSLKGGRMFDAALEYYKKKRAALHFYAESCMWTRYEKPRPYKKGVFQYAVKLDIPIVPMFYGFKIPKGLRKAFGLAKARVLVADPVYPDKNLKARERERDMQERVEKATRELYEQFYGKPLEYAPKIELTQTETQDQN